MSTKRTRSKNPHDRRGIRDRIRSAKSHSEIDALLSEGDKYELASPETRRRWKRAADLQAHYLTHKVLP